MRKCILFFLLFIAAAFYGQKDTLIVNKLNEESFRLRRNQNDSALIKAEKALSISEAINFERGKIHSYDNLGMAYFGLNNYDTALFLVKRSLSLSRSISYVEGEATAYYDLGLIHRYRSDYSQSIGNYYEALRIYESYKQVGAAASCYNDLGNVYYAQQNYAKALQLFLKALNFSDQLSEKKKSSIYMNIGLVYTDIKNFEKAKEFFLKCVTIRQKQNNALAMADVYTNLGVCFLGEAEFKRKNGNVKETAALNREALAYHLKASKVYEEAKNDYAIGLSYSNIGDSYMRLGNYKEAVTYQNKALAIAQKINDKEGMEFIYASLSELYSLTGEFKQAYSYSKKFMNLRDSLQDKKDLNKINEIQTKYETDKRDDEIALLNKDKEIKEIVIEKQNNERVAFVIGLILLLLFTFFVLRSYRQKQKANIIITNQKEEVEKQKQIIEEKNKDITDSIKYAKQIQKAHLPTEEFLSRTIKRLKGK